ncbi:MAG: hypothetical protein EU530_00350 [Promethearchaeota archaeon]|nr:MAG: hypothetical protein EU530_00350 [Candidatus Lokiarchaeota archaeon]
MKFLQASFEDVDTILEINQKNLQINIIDNSRGFLMGTRTKKWISDNLDKYFVVKEIGQVLGYAEIDFTIGKEYFATGKWERESIQKKVLETVDKKNFVYLIQLASNLHRKGVGKCIIEGLSETFKGLAIISFVSFKPYFNEASVHFHEKVDFQKAGLFTIKYKFGIQEYERFSYIKEYK